MDVKYVKKNDWMNEVYGTVAASVQIVGIESRKLNIGL